MARAFHEGKVPGCVVSDALLALVEREAASPDKGRAFALEFAAKQVAIARGLGYRGVYLSGHRRASDIERVLELAAGFGVDDWRGFARELAFGLPGTFYYFEPDPETGLNRDEVNRAYRRSRTKAARRRMHAPLDYRVNRLAHRLVFDPQAPLFPARHARSTGPSKARTSTARCTSSNRPSRSPSTTAATAATARCPTSPIAAPSRTA